MAVDRPSPGDHGRSEVRERAALGRVLAREQRRLGARLRNLRLARQLSQEDAAERIGLSAKHLRRIELGQSNVTLATLVALSVAYAVPVPALFARVGRTA